MSEQREEELVRKKKGSRAEHRIRYSSRDRALATCPLQRQGDGANGSRSCCASSSIGGRVLLRHERRHPGSRTESSTAPRIRACCCDHAGWLHSTATRWESEGRRVCSLRRWSVGMTWSAKRTFEATGIKSSTSNPTSSTRPCTERLDSTADDGDNSTEGKLGRTTEDRNSQHVGVFRSNNSRIFFFDNLLRLQK